MDQIIVEDDGIEETESVEIQGTGIKVYVPKKKLFNLSKKFENILSKKSKSKKSKSKSKSRNKATINDSNPYK